SERKPPSPADQPRPTGADQPAPDAPDFRHAPDEPENDAIARPQKPSGPPRPRPSRRRHGRRR
ncbi:MAG: hypothetical protein ACRDMX_02000, partial [Solirubrobacteraceae bacterium]